jgi:hypothetical protein
VPAQPHASPLDAWRSIRYDPGGSENVTAGPFAAVAVIAWPRQHHEAPLRKQMRARPVTFRAGVDVRASYLGTMLPVTGPHPSW